MRTKTLLRTRVCWLGQANRTGLLSLFLLASCLDRKQEPGEQEVGVSDGVDEDDATQRRGDDESPSQSAAPGVNCGDYNSCDIEMGCNAGQECILLQGCATPICIASASACSLSCPDPDGCMLRPTYPIELSCDGIVPATPAVVASDDDGPTVEPTPVHSAPPVSETPEPDAGVVGPESETPPPQATSPAQPELPPPSADDSAPPSDAGEQPSDSGLPATETPTEPSPRALACMNVQDNEIESQGLSGVNRILTYGDSSNPDCGQPSTYCLYHSVPGQVCLAGIAAESGPDYACYGASVLLQVGVVDEQGIPVQTWDAASAGVVGVRFTIEGLTSAPHVRVQLGDASFALVAHGGGTNDLSNNGEHVLWFEDFDAPSWSEQPNAVLDHAQLVHLQVHVLTASAESRPYDLCLRDLAWIDAAGQPLSIPTPVLE
jgi:hypothetical protein